MRSMFCVLRRSLIFGLLPAISSVAAAGTFAISGHPPVEVRVGHRYSFLPVVATKDARKVKFKIKNKPRWASFSEHTGALEGVPKATAVGRYSKLLISARDGHTRVALPAFSIRVLAAPTANYAPTISGTPAKTASVGVVYSFAPGSSNLSGHTLKFSIANKPSWATFSTATGLLRGRPAATDVGRNANIAVAVSNGLSTVALPTFSIAVSTASQANHSVTAIWTPPTQNTDGSELANLAGYKVYFGTDPASLSHVLQTVGAAVTRQVISGLAAGIWYFALSAYTTAGVEGVATSPVSTTIP